jgi:hypothetical protein
MIFHFEKKLHWASHGATSTANAPKDRALVGVNRRSGCRSLAGIHRVISGKSGAQM